MNSYKIRPGNVGPAQRLSKTLVAHRKPQAQRLGKTLLAHRKPQAKH